MRPERFIPAIAVSNALKGALLLCLIIVGFACSEANGPITIDAPTNVAAVLLNPTTARVTWTASAQADKVTSYNVYRNGTKIGEVTTTSYTDNALTEKTSYSYTVSANGPDGTVSAQSAASQSATIVAPDATPPTVVSSTPAAGATGVVGSSTISITFSEAVDPSTVNATNFVVKNQAGATIAGAVSYTAATNTALFTPTTSLPSNNAVSVTVSGVKDIAGNAMQSPFTLSFTVRDETPPTVVSSTPANGAANVAVGTAVTLQFSKPMQQSTVNATTFTLTRQGGSAVTGTIAYDAANMRATFTPSAPLQNSATYSIAATTGMTDAQGIALTAFTASFTTVGVGDITPPTVLSSTPSNGTANVSVSTAVTVTFSEAMSSSTVTTSTFTLTPSGGSAVAAAVAYNSANNTATLTPTSALAFNTTYTVSVTSGAKDLANNSLTPFTATFTTAAQPDLTRPTITAVSPVNSATGVSANTTVTVTFSEAMNSGTVNSSSFTLTPAGGSPVAATVVYNAGSLTATLTPSSALAFSTTYNVSVSANATDLAGNTLVAFASSFITGAAPDLTAPTILSISPASGATSAPVDQPVVVIFSEPMDANSLTTTTMSLKLASTGVPVPGIVVYNTGTNTGTFYPNDPLAYSTGYTFTVSGVKDLAGNQLQTQSTISFTTAPPPDVTPPGVSSITPAGGATGVATNTGVTVVFNRAMNGSTINSSTITLAPSGGSPVAATVSYNAGTQTATLTPSAALSPSTTYVITVTTGVQGSNNVSLPAQVTSTFVTVAPSDSQPPNVIANTPGTNATGVATTTAVTVTFSEDINEATINSGSFTLSVVGGSTVAGSVSYNPGTRVATFTPSSALSGGLLYEASVSTAIRDLAGNQMASNFAFRFTTQCPSTGGLNAGCQPQWSGTTTDDKIHLHLVFTQNGTTLSLGPCQINGDCSMTPLNQSALDITGPTTPGATWATIVSGSGSLVGNQLSFTFTTDNGRTFTLTATVSSNTNLTGTLSGSTYPGGGTITMTRATAP